MDGITVSGRTLPPAARPTLRVWSAPPGTWATVTRQTWSGRKRLPAITYGALTVTDNDGRLFTPLLAVTSGTAACLVSRRIKMGRKIHIDEMVKYIIWRSVPNQFL